MQPVVSHSEFPDIEDAQFNAGTAKLDIWDEDEEASLKSLNLVAAKAWRTSGEENQGQLIAIYK